MARRPELRIVVKRARVVDVEDLNLLRTSLGGTAEESASAPWPARTSVARHRYEADPSELATLGVGEDSSPEGTRAVEVAVKLGRRLGAAVRARSVVPLQELPSAWGVDPPDWLAASEERVREERARLQEVDDVDGDALFGKPTDQLLALSREVELLVVGSRDLGPLERVLSSSTSTYLAHHVHCPLLVVPRVESTRVESTAAVSASADE